MMNLSLLSRWSVGGLALLVATCAVGEARVLRTEYQPVTLERLAEGLEHPWSIDFLPDGRLLVTERPGQLNLIDRDGSITRVGGTPQVSALRQGGLLEVLVHPDFEENGWVYLTYSKSDGNEGTATALARGRLTGTTLADVEDLYVQERYSAPGRHYGSKLAWLPDGTLLMSVGDRGAEPPRAQALDDSAGKLLRLTEDGKIPADNPFVDHDGALPEIFTLGNRNIQGLLVHPETGAIWSTEHGPRGGDELNLMEAGANYGWPVVSRGRDYRTEEQFGNSVRSRPDMVEPVIDWTPGLAASGLAVLVGDHFPAWQGNVLAGGLRTEQIRRIVFENGEPVHQEELLRGEMGRVRDLRVGPDGNIYVAIDAPNGAVYRISPAG
ncbi:MAG: PQQ-dependent sugar dehydrogenase [Wenzhouxiangella sp.]|jgi:glucose/arabinose dehydrogenase|nr:PQQ-dependent sugar dehydrogenase [Wenzhouxiangella sp.]